MIGGEPATSPGSVEEPGDLLVLATLSKLSLLLELRDDLRCPAPENGLSNEADPATVVDQTNTDALRIARLYLLNFGPREASRREKAVRSCDADGVASNARSSDSEQANQQNYDKDVQRVSQLAECEDDREHADGDQEPSQDEVTGSGRILQQQRFNTMVRIARLNGHARSLSPVWSPPRRCRANPLRRKGRLAATSSVRRLAAGLDELLASGSLIGTGSSGRGRVRTSRTA